MKQHDHEHDAPAAEAAVKRHYEAPQIVETACFERTILAAGCGMAPGNGDCELFGPLYSAP